MIVGLGVLAAGVPAGVRIYQAIRDSYARRYTDSLTMMIDDLQVEQAQEMWAWLEQNEPDLLAQPVFGQIRAKLDEAVAQREGRHEQFASCVKAVEKAGFDQPDWDAIRQAWEFAYLHEEKLHIQRLENQARDRALQRQQELDKAHQAPLKAATAEFERAGPEVRRLLDEDPHAAGKLVDELGQKAQRLAQLPQAGPEVLSAAGALSHQVIRWQQELAAAELRRLILGSQTEASKAGSPCSPEALGAAIEAYLLKEGGSPRGQAMARSREHVPAWSAVADGLELVGEWADLLPADGRELERRRVAISAYLHHYPDGPLQSDFEKAAAWLAEVRRLHASSSDTRPVVPQAPAALRELVASARQRAGCGIAFGAGGTWRLVAGPAGLQDGWTIWTARCQDAPAGGWRLDQVGIVAGGSARLDAQAMQGLPEVTLVFFRKPNGKGKLQ